jgi:hypothetical protein
VYYVGVAAEQIRSIFIAYLAGITPIVSSGEVPQSRCWHAERQVGVATRYAVPLVMRHLHDFLSVNWTKWLASPNDAKLFLS